VTEEIDIIEEVARTYGYNNIETKTRAAIDFSANVRTDLLQNEIREYLIGAGFNEILTIALQDEETAALAGKPAVKILNPVSAEMAALRTSLVTTALRVVQHNRNHGLKDLRLFEMGTVFRKNSVKEENSLENYPEEERLLTVLTGNNLPAGYGNSPRLVDLLDLKGELEALLTKFCLDNYRFIYYDTHDVLTEPGIGIEINGTYAGFFGKVRKELAAKLDIDDPVYICELSVRAIDAAWVRERKFTPLPKFPGVTRDLAFTVDASVPQEAVENTILQAGRPLCVGVILFDMYSGQQTGTGKKSLAYTVEFRSAENTLTDNEIDNVVSGIVESVRQKCNGVLRS
jgi:phenylalanyl-tRNA synthetase beta chain